MKPNRSSLLIALVLTLFLAASLSMAAGVSSPQAPDVEPAEAERPPTVEEQEQLFVPEPQVVTSGNLQHGCLDGESFCPA